MATTKKKAPRRNSSRLLRTRALSYWRHISAKQKRTSSRFLSCGSGQTRALLQLLIPWNGTVTPGLERIIAADSRGACDQDHA